MTKFEKCMEDLEAYCKKIGCGKREAMEELLMEFYETAGFCREALEAEINSMSDDELMKAYLNI